MVTERPIARRMWLLYETWHDVTYFTPESRAATDELGCRGGWMGYFGMRAAPLGAAAPETVTSAFYNFHPSLVYRALPGAWSVASPERYLQVRLAGADAALRRMVGDALESPELVELAELTSRAAGFAPTAGRPLAAANARLPLPDEPHLALWQACTVLRESRGDGHVAALVAASLDPCETLVLFAADRGLDPQYLQQARGWPAEDWAAATTRLTDGGLLSAAGAVTAAGAALRADIERRTDEAAAAPWVALGSGETERCASLFGSFARAVAERNDAMARNPMALDARAELAG